MRSVPAIVLALVLMAEVPPAAAGQMFFAEDNLRIETPFSPHRFANHRHVFRRFNRVHARNDSFVPFFTYPDTVPADNPAIVVEAAPPAPPRPPRTEADERPTVETTPSGVQIVRGPGTHHTLN